MAELNEMVQYWDTHLSTSAELGPRARENLILLAFGTLEPVRKATAGSQPVTDSRC